MSLIKYPITVNYVKSWTFKDAVRELLQNAIDSKRWYQPDAFTISNQITTPITKEQLLFFGESSKQSADCIGKFGEGLKLALLVLAREDIPHMLHLSKNEVDVCRLKGVIVDGQFAIDYEGESPEDANYCLVWVGSKQFQSIVDELIMPNLPALVEYNGQSIIEGKNLYVGGLFICETDLNYSYNFLPSALKLDRDRKAVNTFDLRWEASKLWASCTNYDLVIDLILRECPDVEHIAHFFTAGLRQAIEDHWIKNGKAILAKSEEHRSALEVYTGMRARRVPISYYNAVADKQVELARGSYKPLKDQVREFYESNKKHVRNKARRELRKIVLSTYA